MDYSLFQAFKEDFNKNIADTLLDIYVFETDKHDWQKVIDYLQRETKHDFIFFVNHEHHVLPSRVEEVFDVASNHSVFLCVDKGLLNLHCYFFTFEQIEFDLDPRIITDENRFKHLLDFIHGIGRILQKKVVVTPESNEIVHYLSYDPTIGNDIWSLPNWGSM
ncbi:hypothetical protein [Dictyobacter arantiisoli]|uniref:Uncharacterized protein n=1 Tax=Dictyobacter arantiisoli TaxID=2014874 RepID=A0A5A5TJY9_9CHLR|nr:hypothetical protein [Dictyobacter arantiisoli]GCF11757.1 hypothetical protein KDI_53210 [Dictyobacter arantiisoli]